jgi:hypothetical protein
MKVNPSLLQHDSKIPHHFSLTDSQRMRRMSTAILELSKRFQGTLLDTRSDTRSISQFNIQLPTVITNNKNCIDKIQDTSNQQVLDGSSGNHCDNADKKDELDEYTELSNTLTLMIQNRTQKVVSKVELEPLRTSIQRKTRRFMYFMSIFEHLSSGRGEIDVAELKVYLENQKRKFHEILEFYRTYACELPVVKRNFEVDIAHIKPQEFNIMLSIFSIHLLSHSSKLKRLMELYDSRGTGKLINQQSIIFYEYC